MTMRLAGVVAVAAAMTLWAPMAIAEGPEVMTWSVDGDTRQGVVYPPSARTAGGHVPLVFSFHGRGDDMKNFQSTRMHRAWPEAIVVYFQGLPGGADGLSGWQVERGQDHDRDLKLVDAALTALRRRFTVDQARIYSA